MMLRSSIITFFFGASLWCVFQNQITSQNIVVGGILLVSVRLVFGKLIITDLWVRVTLKKLSFSFVFLLVLLKEIFMANLAVLMRILKFRLKLRSGLIAIPTELHHNVSLVTFANSITLTPGTYTVYIAKDDRCLFVHCLDIDSVEDVRNSIKSSLEKPIRRIETA